MTANNTQAQNISSIGLKAASFLVDNFGEYFVYDNFVELLFQRLEQQIDLIQIRFYVIDSEGENLIEESSCNNTGWLPGYGLISVSSLSPVLIQEKMERFTDCNYYYLRVILQTNSKLLGLIEFATETELSDNVVKEIKAMVTTISFALSSVLFEINTIMEKENTEFNISINNKLQSIDNIDELISVFLQVTEEYFKFDRVTIFLFDKDGKNIFARGINEQGKEFTLTNIPELPDLSKDYLPLGKKIGYWLPLKTNTGLIGAVLYDNIYTLYKISDSTLNTLRILSSEFAKAIDNINMFSSLQRSAHFDRLTGLYNRNYLEEILPVYDRNGCFPISVIMGDLNGLKLTNDVFGHSRGDLLLKKIAEIMKESCTEEDIVIRSGGDEFLILLPGKEELAVDKIMKIIKRKCSVVSELGVPLSISLGCSCRKDKKEKLATVISKAEARMYRQKLLETKNFRNSIISSLQETLEEKCYETAGHIERMAELATKVGIKMGLIGSELDDLKLLAMLHDIGKVVVKSEIFNKSEPLNYKELEDIKKHSEAGYRIAHASYELSHIANYILYHHERWDGSGYPHGKKGKEIPLLSRIISVVDAYDVMTHDRSYKKAISHKEALEELKRCAGIQFDPEIVRIFTQLDF